MRHIEFGVMIFAAGFGTRMGSLVKDRPKPLIPVAGRTLIDHALDQVSEANVHPVVVNAHYKSHMMRDALRGHNVTVVEEQPRVLDTGGGLKNAASLFSTPYVYTLNSDAVWSGPNVFRTLANAWDPDRMDALMLLVEPQNTFGRTAGDLAMDGDGRLHRQGPLSYTGAQIIRLGTLDAVEEPVFSLNTVWDIAMSRGRLFGAVYPGKWCDVGHPEGIITAENMVNSHV